MELSDEDLHNVVQNEARNAIGFGNRSPELYAQREQALEYFKGEMRDVPALKNRSSQVSPDVANIIEAILPDLVEIFEGDEPVLFVPNNPNDTEQAQQETDFVTYVFYQQNNGYELLYKAIKDALLMKTGVFVWDWEPGEPEVQKFANKTEQEFQVDLLSFGDLAPNRTPETPVLGNVKHDANTLLYSYTITTPKEGKCVVKVWRPEDVAVSDDTEILGEGTYCGFRTRVRRNELIADGYDRETVENLPKYGAVESIMMQARDLAGEFQAWSPGNIDPALDHIEITYNYLKYPTETGHTIYRVVTAGHDNEVLLDSEEVSRVNAACLCPFPQPHRFYGESLADKVIPIQQAKTALLRMTLDAGYFANTQRFIIGEQGIGKNGLADLRNNSPGAPIRVQDVGAIKALDAPEMPFDALSMLEYASTMAEEATGVLRSSTGLTPDTLHDTSSGMMRLLDQGQRRVRTMARNFAEGGLKRLFLGIHDCLRENSSMTTVARLRGKWVPVDPTTWGSRLDMSCEIAGAHGGRQYDMSILQQVIGLQTQALQAQSASKLDGPLVTPKQLLSSAWALIERAGIKDPERFFPSPDSIPPQGPPSPPPPDPALIKVQADAQAQAQRLQFDQAKAAADDANAKARIANEARLRELEITLRAQLDRDRMHLEMAAKANQVDRELALKQQELTINARLEAVQTQLADQNEKARIAEEAQRNAIDQTHNLMDMAHDHTMDVLARNDANAKKPDPSGDE